MFGIGRSMVSSFFVNQQLPSASPRPSETGASVIPEETQELTDREQLHKTQEELHKTQEELRKTQEELRKAQEESEELRNLVQKALQPLAEQTKELEKRAERLEAERLKAERQKKTATPLKSQAEAETEAQNKSDWLKFLKEVEKKSPDNEAKHLALKKNGVNQDILTAARKNLEEIGRALEAENINKAQAFLAPSLEQFKKSTAPGAEETNEILARSDWNKTSQDALKAARENLEEIDKALEAEDMITAQEFVAGGLEQLKKSATSVVEERMEILALFG